MDEKNDEQADKPAEREGKIRTTLHNKIKLLMLFVSMKEYSSSFLILLRCCLIYTTEMCVLFVL